MMYPSDDLSSDNINSTLDNNDNYVDEFKDFLQDSILNPSVLMKCSTIFMSNPSIDEESSSSSQGGHSKKIPPNHDINLVMIQEMTERIINLETIVRQLVPLLQAESNGSRAPVDIKRSQLDRHCITLFQVSPEPTPVQLSTLIQTLDNNFPGHERRTLFSIVRRWFRKKREEVGLKVTSAAKRLYGQRLREDKHNFLAQISNGSFDFSMILNEARLPFALTEPIVKFCLEKVLTFIRRIEP